MTTWTDRVPVDEIIAGGRAVRPGRVLVTIILGLFMIPGWVFGRTWLVLADGAVAFRVGYWRGRGMPAEEITRRLQQLAGVAQSGAGTG